MLPQSSYIIDFLQYIHYWLMFSNIMTVRTVFNNISFFSVESPNLKMQIVHKYIAIVSEMNEEIIIKAFFDCCVNFAEPRNSKNLLCN